MRASWIHQYLNVSFSHLPFDSHSLKVHAPRGCVYGYFRGNFIHLSLSFLSIIIFIFWCVTRGVAWFSRHRLKGKNDLVRNQADANSQPMKGNVTCYIDHLPNHKHGNQSTQRLTGSRQELGVLENSNHQTNTLVRQEQDLTRAKERFTSQRWTQLNSIF